jgi:arylsulfatase A-like enzyme
MAVAAGSLFVRATPRNAPNFLFIMTDDQRKDTLSVYGNTILQTPNIDRIGLEGARFDEFFVTNSLCAPSRASFLTGLYSHTHGVTTNASPINIEQVTFVHLLRAAGYETALVGKWHLRTTPQGFDRYVILPGGGGPYVDPTMEANGVPLKMRGYADDVVGDQALAYLQKRAADRPFCLLMNFKAPHRNWTPAPRHADKFSDVEFPIPRTFDAIKTKPAAVQKTDMSVVDMPDFKKKGPENLQELIRNYYRTILSVDDNVGRVLEFLDKNDLTKNTVVLFSSDNGFFLGEWGLYDKRLMYEDSIRVPMLVRYPERVQPGLVDNAHLTLNIDVAPTILALAGVPVPSWMHGRDFTPLLEKAEVPWRDAFLYEFFEFPDADHCVRKNRGVRAARWKLIHFWEQPEEWELYDLQNDPDETRNVIRERRHARVVRELKAKMAELRRETGDADPPGPPPVAVTCHGR